MSPGSNTHGDVGSGRPQPAGAGGEEDPACCIVEYPSAYQAQVTPASKSVLPRFLFAPAESSYRSTLVMVEHCLPTASGSTALSVNTKRVVQKYMSFARESPGTGWK